MTKKDDSEAVSGNASVGQGTLNFWIVCAIFNLLIIANMVVKINNLQDDIKVLNIELSEEPIVQYCTSDLYKPNIYSF